MSDSTVTGAEYWQEIRDLAAGLLEQCREYGPNGRASTAEDVREYAHDSALHEAVDGHQWVIYPAYHMSILLHSPNDEAYFAEFGPIDNVESLSDVTTKLVYYAMECDVREALDTLLEDYEPDDPDAPKDDA